MYIMLPIITAAAKLCPRRLLSLVGTNVDFNVFVSSKSLYDTCNVRDIKVKKAVQYYFILFVFALVKGKQ